VATRPSGTPTIQSVTLHPITYAIIKATGGDVEMPLVQAQRRGKSRVQTLGNSNELQEMIMTLVLNCRDVGFDCEGVVRAETEDELLQKVAEHAKSVHNLEEVTAEIVEKVKSVISVEK
jgi:predicted small metal-binding protein